GWLARLQQRRRRRLWATLTGLVCLGLSAGLIGCSARPTYTGAVGEQTLEKYHRMIGQVDYPDVTSTEMDPAQRSAAPLTIESQPGEQWSLTLDETVQMALGNSTVLRDLGGQVLNTPVVARTTYGPALSETDPRQGVQAALAAFDAQATVAANFDKNDFISNNRFLAGGTNQLSQNLHSYRFQLSKKAATGTEFTARSISSYDFNNAPGNFDPNLPWTTYVEGEFRHPLFQGSGVDFNRIAGPNATPGVYNGVTIARLNTDISTADFELGLRDYINNVENAYWDLYYAYRDLEAKTSGREETLKIWEGFRTRIQTKSALQYEKEAQSREQYYRLSEEVQNAFSGKVQTGTRSGGDIGGGTFRAVPGVQVAERRLRLLIGLPINDGRIIVPKSDPCLAPMKLDWNSLTAEALARRPELQRQRLQVKRRELELLASRNFLLPRLDLIGRYRFRGTGVDLWNNSNGYIPGTEALNVDNAVQNLVSGDYPDWRLGGELTFPVGFRQGHAAVRNAQLFLARERALLTEQERSVLHDLSNAYSDVARTYELCMLAAQRRDAARQRYSQLRAEIPQDPDTPSPGKIYESRMTDLLEAIRRVVDAESTYHAAVVENALAIKNVHFEKGSLLEYNNVHLADELSRTSWNSRTATEDGEIRDYTLPEKEIPQAETGEPTPAPTPARREISATAPPDEAAPGQPAATDPAATDPAATDPAATDPASVEELTSQAGFETIPTTPAPAITEPLEPEPTQP
ncbi:MAG: TolC family protein, partial [Planctomycetota bacterium]